MPIFKLIFALQGEDVSGVRGFEECGNLQSQDFVCISHEVRWLAEVLLAEP